MKKILFAVSVLLGSIFQLQAQTKITTKTHSTPAVKSTTVKVNSGAGKTTVVSKTTANPSNRMAVTRVERPLKMDGTPDKRYKVNTGIRKDGKPDKRYKANKKG